jgi:glycosyltransferase involved in cell wall biosynthesis
MGGVHIWAPDLFPAGGIQQFSRHFIAALTQVLPNEQVRVLVKNDRTTARGSDAPVVAEFGHWPRSLRTPRFSWACLQSAWRERPSVIVSMHLHFGPLAHLVNELTGIPYILVAHGIDAWGLASPARKEALGRANRIFAVSRYTRERLMVAHGIPSERIEILPNTFLPERFFIGDKSPALQKRYGFTSATRVILTVCRLVGSERYKGYDQVIRALPQILREVPETRYLIAGAGLDRPRIEKLACELAVRDAVVFAGFVPDEELRDHYNLCDLFAMPSKAEGFGIVYLEALACGKPVLAGNQDGSRDALADGDLGLLVDPNDTTQIATETIRILRREHPHANLFRPEYLRGRVTELFGFERFKATVTDRLAPFIGDGRRPQTAEADADSEYISDGGQRSVVVGP